MHYYIVTKTLVDIPPGSVVGLMPHGAEHYKDHVTKTKFQVGDIVLASRQYKPKILTKIVKISANHYFGEDPNIMIKIGSAHEEVSILIQR